MEIKNKEFKAALCQIKGAVLRLYKEPVVIILFLVFVLASVFSHELYAIILWLLLVLAWYWGVAGFGGDKRDTSTLEKGGKNKDKPVKGEEEKQGKKPLNTDASHVIEKEEAQSDKTKTVPKEPAVPKAEKKDKEGKKAKQDENKKDATS